MATEYIVITRLTDSRHERPRKRRTGTRVLSGTIQDTQHTSLTNEVGNDFVDPNIRISPILDTDINRYMYAHQTDNYANYNALAKMEIGQTQNSDGTTRVHDDRAPRGTTRVPLDGTTYADRVNSDIHFNNTLLGRNHKEHMGPVDERSFIENPLTLLNVSRINLSSPDNKTYINSIARVTLLVGGVSYCFTNPEFLKEHNMTIIVGIVLALLVFTVFRANKEAYSMSTQDPTSGNMYLPRDLSTSIEMNKRVFDPYKWNAMYGPRPYPGESIRY